MSKKIIGIALAGLGIAGSFAGGMLVSNNLKDENYSLIVTEKESEITSISETLNDLNREIAEKDTEISLLKATKDDLQAKYNELQKTNNSDKEELVRLNTKVQELNTQISTLETQLNGLKNSYSNLQERFTSLKEEYDSLLAQSEVKQQEIESLNGTISNLNNQITEYSSQVNSLNDELQEIKNKFNNISKVINDFSISYEAVFGYFTLPLFDTDGNFLYANSFRLSVSVVDEDYFNGAGLVDSINSNLKNIEFHFSHAKDPLYIDTLRIETFDRYKVIIDGSATFLDVTPVYKYFTVDSTLTYDVYFNGVISDFDTITSSLVSDKQYSRSFSCTYSLNSDNEISNLHLVINIKEMEA